MSLEEDLKARTLALISQQMATWVVEIQRSIGQHQEALVRSLDELQSLPGKQGPCRPPEAPVRNHRSRA